MKTLKQSDNTPYKILFAQLREQIKSGHIQGKLPSIAELTRSYEVSHNTVKKVFDLLKEQKYVYGHQGKGVYVNDLMKNSPAFQKHIVLYLHIETYKNPMYLHFISILRRLLEKEQSIVHFINSHRQIEPIIDNTDVLLIIGLIEQDEAAELKKLIPHDKIIQMNECNDDFKCVTTDNFAGGCIAAEYLHKQGHKNIGLISRYLGDNCFFRERGRGFYEYTRQHPDMKVFEYNAALGYTLSSSSLETVGRQVTELLFSEHRDITAIFSFTDTLAMGIMSYCIDKGIKIPDDISIIGFDNRDFSSMLTPPLTTIQENIKELAVSTVKLIYSTVKKQHHSGTGEFKVAPFLVERKSVKRI